MELLLGCGANRDRRVVVAGRRKWTQLVTLDHNSAHAPDVLWDLTSTLPLPWPADYFDEIHAYEVLEHLGAQGDYRAFFRQFEDYWRVLKPGGHLAATCPSWRSMWAWGDPGHTRVISAGSLAFLSQAEYQRQVGVTSMCDYRFCYRGDLRQVYAEDDGETFTFVLRAVKGPTRVSISVDRPTDASVGCA